MKLDQRDREILQAVQSDSSPSVAELARRFGLSAPGLKKRLLKLHEGGVLERQVALVNREAIGLDVLCFVQVTLAHHQTETVEHFRRAIRALPEVLECHLLTGEFDYLIKVVTANHHRLERFLVEKLTALPGVDKIRTSIVLNEIKSSTALPLSPPDGPEQPESEERRP